MITKLCLLEYIRLKLNSVARVSERSTLSDRRLLVKLVPIFVDRGYHTNLHFIQLRICNQLAAS
jgi:hypothetical protein